MFPIRLAQTCDLEGQNNIMIINGSDLNNFIMSLCEPKNLFVLGAGASAEFIRPGSDFLRKVGTLWLSGGGFSPRKKSSPIAKKILSSCSYPRELDALIISYMPERGGEWLVSYMLSLPEKIKRIFSYEVFKRFQRPFSIINYNHDNLARLSLQGVEEVTIFEPHGSTHPRLQNIFDSAEIHEIADLDIPIPDAESLIMLRREPSEFSSSRFFSLLDNYRTFINKVIFIGYSFSQQVDGTKDDIISYEYFGDFLKTKDVFVVSPNAISMAEELRDHVRNSRILPVQLRWDLLSKAIEKCNIVFNQSARSSSNRILPVLMNAYTHIEKESLLNEEKV